MALIHNNNLAVYAGVSKQAVDLRLPTHCEEMLNCYPSVQYGVRRRNPTREINATILAEDNQFMHTYDRGLSGETSEQYVVTIDDVNKLRVFDVVAGEYRTVTYDGNSANYLSNSNPELGFSAITIKDSTFIANKDISPLREGELSSSVNYSKISIDTTGYSKSILFNTGYFFGLTSKEITNLAPARIATYKTTTYYYGPLYAISSLGCRTIVTVNGITINYRTKIKTDAYNSFPETMSEYRANLKDAIESALPDYTVVYGANNDIYIYDVNGLGVATTVTIDTTTASPVAPQALTLFPSLGWVLDTTVNHDTDPTTITTGSANEIVMEVSEYDKEGYIWIKQVSIDTAFPYTFYVTLQEPDGTLISTTSTAATTATGVASAIQSWANALTGFTAVVSGSVVKITRDDGTAYEMVVSDTYGSQASSAWKGSVTNMSDLPKSFPFKGTVVKIDGIDTTDDVAYWVMFDGNQWVEHRDPNMIWKVRASTMPHQLVRNPDLTFTLKEIAWKDILVGDDNSQSIPEFFADKIQDLFFVNGRLGILSKNGISLSQQGDFSNFFRTTVLSLLDDSAITTYIDSSKSVGLEHATELQGSIILFGDKLQFALDASKPITPNSVSIQPVCGFEINKNVRPVSVGDSVFFLVSNNGYSSLMEMNRDTISSTIGAEDVSSHVPDYIDSDIMQIVASDRDGVVFLRSRSFQGTLYVYKHYKSGRDKIQMAWSKWTFDMDLKSVFVFDKELYLFGYRYDATVPLSEFTFVGTWDDSKYWIDETYWVDGEVLSTPSFEKMDIDAYGNDALFKDLSTVRYNSEIELSEWALADKQGQKELRGNLLIKTIGLSSSDGSSFYLRVEDIERGTSRNIPSVFTVDRRPFVSGNAKNTRIKVISSNGEGFQINSISLEGQYNVRSRRK